MNTARIHGSPSYDFHKKHFGKLSYIDAFVPRFNKATGLVKRLMLVLSRVKQAKLWWKKTISICKAVETWVHTGPPLTSNFELFIFQRKLHCNLWPLLGYLQWNHTFLLTKWIRSSILFKFLVSKMTFLTSKKTKSKYKLIPTIKAFKIGIRFLGQNYFEKPAQSMSCWPQNITMGSHFGRQMCSTRTARINTRPSLIGILSGN